MDLKLNNIRLWKPWRPEYVPYFTKQAGMHVSNK